MRSFGLMLVSLLLGACVTKGTHEALQKEFDAAKARHAKDRREWEEASAAARKQHEAALGATRQKYAAEMEKLDAQLLAEQQKLAEASRRIDSLNNDIAQERAKLGEQSKRVQQLEAELARLVKDRSALASSVDEMKSAIAELARRKAETEARLAEFRSLIDRFRKLIDAGKLRVKIVEGRMVVELATDVLFASGQATLSKDGRTAIAEVALVLAEIPDRKFQVEGHTDNVPISTATYPSNWELAAARAITVVRTMIDNGMPAARVSAASYGDSRPARPNDSPENKQANRRIEIVLVPDLSSLPGFDELNRAAAAQ